jgi:hypothetical protein
MPPEAKPAKQQTPIEKQPVPTPLNATDSSENYLKAQENTENPEVSRHLTQSAYI